MQITYRYFNILLACILVSNVQAQLVGQPRWIEMPLEIEPGSSLGPVSNTEKSYAIKLKGDSGPGTVVSGHIYFFDGGHAPVTTPLTVPGQNGHPNLHALVLFKDSPFLVYDSYDKKTGEVRLFMQQFSSTDFSPLGEALEFGLIPLEKSLYQGGQLTVGTRVSADGSHLLVYFDDAQYRGARVLECWVFDGPLKMEWNGGYQLPVATLYVEADVRLADSGHVLIQMDAVLLNEGNTKDRSDGSTKVRMGTVAMTDVTTSFFDIRGSDMRIWDGKLPGGEILRHGDFLQVGGKTYFGGVLGTEKLKEVPTEWVMGELDASFKPVVRSRGSFASTDLPPVYQVEYRSRLLGSPTAGFYLVEAIKDDLVLLKFDASLNKAWEHRSAWGLWVDDFYVVKDRLIKAFATTERSYQALENGKSVKWGYSDTDLLPMLFHWGDDGQRHQEWILPATTPSYKHYMDFSSIGRFGAFIRRSPDPKKPGFVVVPLL